MIRNLNNFCPSTALEAHTFLQANIRLSYPMRFEVGYDAANKVCNIAVIDMDRPVASIAVTDLTNFRDLFKKLSDLNNVVDEHNKSIATIDSRIVSLASPPAEMEVSAFNPKNYFIRLSPCLYLDNTGLYNKLRFDQIGKKKSRTKCLRSAIDDAIVNLYLEGRTVNVEATRQSVAAFIDTCQLPYQLTTPLTEYILADKRLLHDAMVKPVNISGLSEFGHLTTIWMVESKNAPDKDEYVLTVIIPIKKKNRVYIEVPHDVETVDLHNPKKHVATLLSCGDVFMLYLSDHTILVADPMRSKLWHKNGGECTWPRSVLRDPEVWQPIDPRDEWTRMKVTEAISYMEV